VLAVEIYYRSDAEVLTDQKERNGEDCRHGLIKPRQPGAHQATAQSNGRPLLLLNKEDKTMKGEIKRVAKNPRQS
jgi:hypothetical protein